MDSYANTVAAGFAHSVAVDEKGQLFVWGNNQNQQLQPHGLVARNTVLERPTKIDLRCETQYIGLEVPSSYQAFDVAAGPQFTLCVAKRKEEECLTALEEQEQKHIMSELKTRLLSNQTLADFFGLVPPKNDNEDEDEDRMNFIDPFQYEISLDTFIGAIKNHKISNQTNSITLLGETIRDNGKQDVGTKSVDKKLNLGIIEDYALGFRQHNIKVFMFGQAHKKLGSFESKIEDEQKGKKGRKKAMGDDDEENEQLQIVKSPVAIKFPRFTNPIISISCGADHALALTIEQEMYSWGAGNYGALGFGFREAVEIPTLLEIIDYKGAKYKISQVCCGKFHSMCLTTKQNIFTWGQGNNGRLGHGEANEEDQLIPKEIYTLSQRKPIFLAAGESHSAAITEKHHLYTWGNGGFGRLGHEADQKECSPKLVEELEDEPIIKVSCGSFHTLAVSAKGNVYAFGQNKYGKLGIHRHNTREGDAYKVPVKISMYKMQGGEAVKAKNDIVSVCAGFNHSLAQSKTGKLYSWGYKGKGLLGRKCDDANALYNTPLNLELMPTLQTGLTQFQRKMLQERGAEVNALMSKQGKAAVVKDFYPLQVLCAYSNTMALTSSGEVYVLGDNTYGQHGREELPKKTGKELAAIRAQEQMWQGDKNRREKHFKSYGRPSLIKFPTADKIEYIACGGEHLFAKTALDEIYGWGRNDEGQIGVGFLTDKIIEPMFIKGLSYKGIKQIACGENYSAAVTIYGEVHVAGSLEKGKLGLGKGQKRGYQLHFRMIEDLPEIEYISCGVDHMLAISRYDPSNNKFTGKTFAWGKNHKGQLGIGNVYSQYSPVPINNTKERFKKVACGASFSLGLSHTNRIYFWGNFKYYCHHSVQKNIEEPTIMISLEQNEVIDIACSYKYAIAIIDKGEMRIWGKYLAAQSEDKNDKSKTKKAGDDDEQETKVLQMSKFPSNTRFQVQMTNVETGPNHSVSFSNSRTVYVWGNNSVNNRLGLQEPHMNDFAKVEPQMAFMIHNQIEQEKEQANAKHVQFEKEEEDENEESEKMDESEEEKVGSDEGSEVGNNDIMLNLESDNEMPPEKSVSQKPKQDDVKSIKSAKTNKSLAVSKAGKPTWGSVAAAVNQGGVDVMAQIIQQIGNHNKKADKHKSVNKSLCIFDPHVDLYTLEFIRQQLHRKEQAVLPPITTNPLQIQGYTLLDMNKTLQKILKVEEQNQLDEKTITILDTEVKVQVNQLLRRVMQFSLLQKQNKDLLLRSKGHLLGRISEVPFKIDSKEAFMLRQKGIDDVLQNNKKKIQRALTLLQVHPCYIAKILESGLFSSEDMNRLVRQLFTSSKRTGTLRCNYLLMSIYERILAWELPDNLEDVDLCGFKKKTHGDGDEPKRELISTFIFELIFDSQTTNFDTIACIACHIINQIQMTFQNNQGEMDQSLDVCEAAGRKDGGDAKGAGKKGGGKAGAGGGGGGGSSQGKRAADLIEFLKTQIDDIINNKILRDSAQWFAFKKQVTNQLDFIRKQFKNYQAALKSQSKGEANPSQKDSIAGQSKLSAIAGIDAEQVREKLPSLRFSEEVIFMVNVLYKQLRRLNYNGSGNKDDPISAQILGLIFRRPMQKCWDNYELNLYPYLSKIKLLTLIDDGIKQTHKINIDSAVHTFNALISGTHAFPEREDKKENWLSEMNAKLDVLSQSTRPQILTKILESGKEVCGLLSYMNFEHMVTHCMEQDNSRVCMSKKLIGVILQTISSNPKQIALQKPEANDALIKAVAEINDECFKKLRETSSYEDMWNLKLKTRLFVPNFDDSGNKKYDSDANLAQFVRCINCNATLLQEIAIQNYDENIVYPIYEPLDKEALVTCYQDILRVVPVLNKQQIVASGMRADGGRGDINSGENGESTATASNGEQDMNQGPNIAQFIEQTSTNARKNAEYKISNMIQNFRNKLKIEVANLKSKQAAALNQKDKETSKGQGQDLTLICQYNVEDEEGMKVQLSAAEKLDYFEKEQSVLLSLIETAEYKYHTRVKQKFDLRLIQLQIEQFLLPQVNSRYDFFKNEILEQQEMLGINFQLGIANRDFFDLKIEGLQQLDKIRKFQTAQKHSKTLGDMDGDQKKNIRGYLQIDCKTLKDNGTIKSVRLKELEEMMPQCHVVLIENDEGHTVQFKMIYRETKFNVCGANKVLKEQLLLNFEISPKKLKETRAQMAKDLALKDKQENAEEEGEGELLVFPENDALGFDPDLFLRLLTQMERQKSAITGSAPATGKKKKKRTRE